MANPRLGNRTMFWRIVGRLLAANRPRLFVLLLALGAGAAITASLLNLEVDAKRRLTAEFRAFGANVIIAPRMSAEAASPATIPESVLDKFPAQDGQSISWAAFLYATANVAAYTEQGESGTRLGSGPAVIAGFRFGGADLAHVVPYRVIEGEGVISNDAETCEIGEKAATQFQVHPAEALEIRTRDRTDRCIVSQTRSFGGMEDNQVFVSMRVAQQLTGLSRQVSLVQLSVPGTPQQVEEYVAFLKSQLPDLEVRPVRQFTEAEGKIYNRISGLLTATVALVLILTALCVMAGMTNAAMERKTDVGLMKAIGGATRRVMRIFVAEAAVLGLAGGLIGAAVGIVLSMWLGHAVFGVAARPRLIVYPVAVLLTIIVAIVGALPLRRLTAIRPAAIFRGEA